MRPETGSMEFGADWRGVFIRGDDAFSFWMDLGEVLNSLESLETDKINMNPLLGFQKRNLARLKQILEDSKQDSQAPSQIMKEYERCLIRRDRWDDEEEKGSSAKPSS